MQTQDKARLKALFKLLETETAQYGPLLKQELAVAIAQNPAQVQQLLEEEFSTTAPHSIVQALEEICWEDLAKSFSAFAAKINPNLEEGLMLLAKFTSPTTARGDLSAPLEKMASDLSMTPEGLIGNTSAISKINLKDYVTDSIGMLTLNDIVAELKKPGVDPRKTFESTEFSTEINTIEDLKENMVLDGTVTNVTNFGAFVDIGVHQDGLVHISKLSDHFVTNPLDVVSVGETIKVKVLKVDTALSRISLEKI